MAVAPGHHATHQHDLSRSDAAPPKPYTNGERAMEDSSGAGGCSLTIGNLPTGANYQQLRTYARSCGAAPAWAVVHSAGDGVVGYLNKHAATEALEALSSASVFHGQRLTFSMNIDQRSRHSARSCRYGALCRGKDT